MKKRILLITISTIVSLSFVPNAFAYVVNYTVENQSSSPVANITMLCQVSPRPSSAVANSPLGGLNPGQTNSNGALNNCYPGETTVYAGLSYTTSEGIVRYCPPLKITTDNSHVSFKFKTHQEQPGKKPIPLCISSQQ